MITFKSGRLYWNPQGCICNLIQENHKIQLSKIPLFSVTKVPLNGFFKILMPRSKKYDFLFLSYLFFFLHLKCLHPLSMLFWTLGKKICGHLAVFQETRLRLNICHIFSVFLSSGKWRSTSPMLSLSLTHSVTFKVCVENCFWVFLPSFPQRGLSPPPALIHLFLLLFLSPQYLEFFIQYISFIKYKTLWNFLVLLNQGR